jgi:hypothetical protein
MWNPKSPDFGIYPKETLDSSLLQKLYAMEQTGRKDVTHQGRRTFSVLAYYKNT